MSPVNFYMSFTVAAMVAVPFIFERRLYKIVCVYFNSLVSKLCYIDLYPYILSPQLKKTELSFGIYSSNIF